MNIRHTVRSRNPIASEDESWGAGELGSCKLRPLAGDNDCDCTLSLVLYVSLHHNKLYSGRENKIPSRGYSVSGN